MGGITFLHKFSMGFIAPIWEGEESKQGTLQCFPSQGTISRGMAWGQRVLGTPILTAEGTIRGYLRWGVLARGLPAEGWYLVSVECIHNGTEHPC